MALLYGVLLIKFKQSVWLHIFNNGSIARNLNFYLFSRLQIASATIYVLDILLNFILQLYESGKN
jgi:hypothetical protein